jgi:hypothetical protein
MPTLTSAVDGATRRLPKIVSPKAHAVLDYVTVGAFLIAGAFFWRRNRSAAIASLLCGGTELAVSLLTDYAGGNSRLISFPTHAKLDIGLAAMAATMPEFMGFPMEGERHFFSAQAGLITVAANLTNFDKRRLKPVRRASRDRR